MEQQELEQRSEELENYKIREVKSHMKNGPENAITLFANAILMLGITATLICGLTTIFVDTPTIHLRAGEELIRTTNEFNPTGLILTITILFYSILQWAFMKVISNISLNLKDINNKLK